MTGWEWTPQTPIDSYHFLQAATVVRNILAVAWLMCIELAIQSCHARLL